MPLQKRKASAGDEEGAADHNKRRRTVEETQASPLAQSKFQNTENECANTVSVDEEVTQLSKPKEIGDSNDGQSSSSLNLQSVPVTAVTKPQQNPADALVSPAQTVLAFKSLSETAETQHDMVKRNTDSDIELPANIVDQPDTIQTGGGHGIQNHVDDVEASLTKTADKESVSTKTGPQFKFSFLYRLLRRDENPKENGIRAQCQRANFSVHKHVSEGSNFGTQYISTSASRSAMLAFAENKKRFPKKIAEIDVRELEKQGNVEFIDLTDQRHRENLLQDQRAKNLARKYEEVLVRGEIPASCITTVDTYWKSDFDSDYSDSDESIDSDFDYY